MPPPGWIQALNELDLYKLVRGQKVPTHAVLVLLTRCVAFIFALSVRWLDVGPAVLGDPWRP